MFNILINKIYYILMSWEMLPLDICVYILKIRNEIRNNSSNIIQNAWRKYIISDIIAIDTLLEIEIDQYNEIIVSLQSTEDILKTSLSICSGKFYLKLWKEFAEFLSISLENYKYPVHEWLTPETVNYRKVKIQYKKLLTKFNF